MSDDDRDDAGQFPPDLSGYGPALEDQPVVSPARDEPTKIEWSVPAEQSPQWSVAPDEPTNVPLPDAVSDEAPPWSIASDEPMSIPWPAVVHEGPQWSVAPDEPMSIDFTTSVTEPVQGDVDVDADRHDRVAAQVEQFSHLGPLEHIGESTVQRMYDEGADLRDLKAVAAAIDHRVRGSDPHQSNNTQIVDFELQLSRLVADLDDQWKSEAKRSTIEDLVTTATTLAGPEAASNTESFNQMQLKIVTDELTTRYNAEIDSWLNGVPTDVAVQRISDMYQAASVRSDPFLEASAKAREVRLHERIFHASVKSLSNVSLDDIGTRIQDLRGATGIVARAELDAIRFHVDSLSRESESDLWMDRSGRQGTRVVLGRLETLEAYERGKAANKYLPGAIIFHYTQNAELAAAVNSLIPGIDRWQTDHASQRLNTAPSLERPQVIDRRPAPDRRPADPPIPWTD